MTSGNETWKSPVETTPTSDVTSSTKRLARNPISWFAISIAFGLTVAYITAPLVADEVAAHDRVSEITKAARAWSYSDPTAIKRLSKVSISGLNTAKTSDTARTIGGLFLVFPAYEAGFSCITAAMNDEGAFLPEAMGKIRAGLETSASADESALATKICNASIKGEDSLIFPVGFRGSKSTVAWLAQNKTVQQIP